MQRPDQRRASFAIPHLRFFGAQLVCFLSLLSLIAIAQAPSATKPAGQSASPAAASPSSHASSKLDIDADPPGLLYQGIPAEIPQDEGLAGLRLELLRLGTTARLMQVVAHPDDEDGGMLTLEARGHGVSTLLMTLNRGEGGQNKIGSNLSDVLGVLRALELLASDQSYGIQDRFSRVADFGFSKSPEETFQKWGGHDVALRDMVRVIRTFRPDVLVPRFSGTERDGHGHHQASSILAQEAFRAAADPKRFPEQIAEGLLPWQAKKLYIGNVCDWGSTTCLDPKWSLRLNTGVRDPDLGMSYIQFAVDGLRHQKSQGAANWTVEPGDRFSFYKLVDSVLPGGADKDGTNTDKEQHEKSFFDGIETTLPSLAPSSASAMRAQLAGIAKLIQQAADAAKGDNAAPAVAPLLKIVAGLRRVNDEIRASTWIPGPKARCVDPLSRETATG